MWTVIKLSLHYSPVQCSCSHGVSCYGVSQCHIMSGIFSESHLEFWWLLVPSASIILTRLTGCQNTGNISSSLLMSCLATSLPHYLIPYMNIVTRWSFSIDKLFQIEIPAIECSEQTVGSWERANTGYSSWIKLEMELCNRLSIHQTFILFALVVCIVNLWV